MRFCCVCFLKCQKFCKHILRQNLACEVENMAKKNEKVRIAKKQAMFSIHILLLLIKVSSSFCTVLCYLSLVGKNPQ